MNAKQEPDDTAKDSNADDSTKTGAPTKTGADYRRERAAEQLRANLSRRKQQARARRVDTGEG